MKYNSIDDAWFALLEGTEDAMTGHPIHIEWIVTISTRMKQLFKEKTKNY
ncbi:MAG: hypothetical protein HFG97_12680 [Dorea sp.]|nr:hypothetical protein [Dorea sp.]